MSGEAGATAIPPGMHRFTQMERVIHGQPVAAVLARELELLGARRVFLALVHIPSPLPPNSLLRAPGGP